MQRLPIGALSLTLSTLVACAAPVGRELRASASLPASSGVEAAAEPAAAVPAEAAPEVAMPAPQEQPVAQGLSLPSQALGGPGGQPPVIVEEQRLQENEDRFVLGVMFGQRSLESEDFTPLDDPWSFGVDLAIKPGDVPFAVEFGTQFGGRTNSGIELTQAELFLGGRLYVLPGYRVRPFVSGGGTLMTAELAQGQFVTDESSTGLYLRGGLLAEVTEFFSIGAEYRWVTGTEFDLSFGGLGGQDTDLDYGQWAVGFLFHF
jgi:opacity protein-like surface antigen